MKYAYEVSIGDDEESLRSGTTGWLPEPILNRLLSIKQQLYSAQEAHKRGFTLTFGSDVGVVEHGDNAGEFQELIKIGMTPMAAIVTATVNAAAALGMEDQVGSLQPGLSADLIAVAADPLADINELKKVVFVMREGVVYKDSL